MEQTIVPPTIEQLLDIYPPAFNRVPLDGRTQEDARMSSHNQLLEYVKQLMDSDSNRSSRLRRYAYSDKVISTWQKLSKSDSKRKQKQTETGQAQAINMNLPLVTTALDDLTSFFSEIYAPVSGAYYTTPRDPAVAEATKELLTKMNEDALATAYYSELVLGIRSLLKYNIGGYLNDWVAEDVDNDSSGQVAGMNVVQALDMYNFMWDPSVTDPRKIRLDAEWCAIASTANRRHLVQRELDGQYHGIKAVIDEDKSFGSANHTSKAKYYRYPPTQAGVTSIDSETGDGDDYAVDWEAYGATLGGDALDIKNSYELVTMYVWLNPNDFGLTDPDSDPESEPPADGYYLWKIKMLAGERIIEALPYSAQEEGTVGAAKVNNLPVYVSLLHNDDMKQATRSTGELMIPFQNFSSFLLNAHVSGARGAIFGLQVYDPTMIDMSALDGQSDMVARLPSKIPGRDVRTGLSDSKGTYDSSQTMNQVAGVQSLMKEFFPNQALPAQIASMDRAVQSQVSAVMQGASRRLHMLVRVLDENVFNPMRFDQYRHIAAAGTVKLEGVSDTKVRAALGSGLAQLTREAMEQAVRTVLMSMMSNPKVIEEYDINSIFNYWGSLLNAPVDLAAFKLQRNPQAALAPGGAAPGTPGLGGGMPPGPPVAPVI